MMLELLAGGALIGLVGLMFAAPLSGQTRYGTKVGNIFASLSTQTLDRPAISVGAHTDLSLRKLSFDDVFETEEINVGGVSKKVTMTPQSVQRWGKRPFVFVDEVFGSTFDLRDVLIGGIEHEHKQDGDMVISEYQYGTNENGEQMVVGLTNYVRAFFEVRERQALDMDIDSSVRPITDGAEDASSWERVWEGVKRMFLPYKEDVGILKLVLPVAAFGGALILGFYIFGPGMLPGGESTRTVGVGAKNGALLLSLSGVGIRDRLGNVSTKTKHTLAGVVTVGLLGLGSVLTVGVGATLFLAAGIAVGAAVLPLLSVAIISALPAKLAEATADIWMTLGLKAFEDPMIDQTERGEMRVVEAEDVGLEGTRRYRFCKSLVGFTCDVSPKAFGNSAISGRELGDYRSTQLRPDGGESALPEGMLPTTRITNANHQGLVPDFENTDPKATYVRSDRWLGRFRNAATGKVTERAQQEATKEFAAGDPELGDRMIMIASLGTFVAGLAISVVIWGL